MKKKITHIINGLSIGGAETALYRLLSTMSDSDYEFSVIVLTEPGAYSSKISGLGIPVQYLALKKTNFIKAFWRLLLLIRQLKPDIVQTWLYHADLIGGCGAKFCGVNKIIWGIRCEGIGLKKTTQRIKMLCAPLSWIIPDFIISNSQAAIKRHRQLGYNGKKFKLIYNGFDDKQFYPNTNRPPSQRKLGDNPLPQDALIFGTLARFHPDKDYPTLIRAIAIVAKIYPNAYFVFCGPGCHENNRELKASLGTLEHYDKIILLDGIDDTLAYLNSLDIFILASRTESFPNSLAEAMLCGLPCIATDVGEVGEILGDTGLLVASQAPQKLAAACIDMLSKPLNERQQLGARARARIAARYSSENYRQQLALVYGQRKGSACAD